jgi:hypothetical protein
MYTHRQNTGFPTVAPRMFSFTPDGGVSDNAIKCKVTCSQAAERMKIECATEPIRGRLRLKTCQTGVVNKCKVGEASELTLDHRWTFLRTFVIYLKTPLCCSNERKTLNIRKGPTDGDSAMLRQARDP